MKTLIPAAGDSLALPSAILALSPLGYWPLNEGATVANASGTAVDASGNGRNGTYEKSTGTFANAVGPDGADYADFGNTNLTTSVRIADNNAWSVNNASGLTVVAMIKPDSVGGTTRQFVVAKGGSGSAKYEWDFYINFGVGGRIQYVVDGPSGNVLQLEGFNNPVTTAWQAVAWSTPNGTQNTRGKVYRNSSTPLGTTQGATTAATYTNDTSELWIGWRQDGPGSQGFTGGIAHVAIFAGQMSDGNMGTIMSAADADGWF